MNRGLLIIVPFLPGLGVAFLIFTLWSANETAETPPSPAKAQSTTPKANPTGSFLPAPSHTAPTRTASSGSHYNHASTTPPPVSAPELTNSGPFVSTPSSRVNATVVASSSFSSGSSQQAAPPSTTQPSSAGTIVSAVGPALNVPFGARVPVAFVADDTPHTPQQAEAINKIAEDFNTAVSSNPGDATGTDAPSISEEEIWEQARQVADNRYRVLFGDDAANRIQMKAALEALHEKAPAAASTSTPAN